MGFLELSVGVRSFSINATRVWMDCNASESLAFGGVEVVWSGVGVVIRSGVGGRRVWASFGLVPVVLECGAGLGSRSRRCVCDEASKRLSFCCTRANMSFLSAKAASISQVMTSGCPPFASCIVHMLISCSITRNSCMASCMWRSTLSRSAIGLSCSGGVSRGALFAGLDKRFMFVSVPGVSHSPWYRVGLDGSAPCIWLVCVDSSWRVGRVLNIPVHKDPAMFSSQGLGVCRKFSFYIYINLLTLWVRRTLIFRRRMWVH